VSGIWGFAIKFLGERTLGQNEKKDTRLILCTKLFSLKAAPQSISYQCSYLGDLLLLRRFQ
jgi:hypothetical protein